MLSRPGDLAATKHDGVSRAFSVGLSALTAKTCLTSRLAIDRQAKLLPEQCDLPDSEDDRDKGWAVRVDTIG